MKRVFAAMLMAAFVAGCQTTAEKVPEEPETTTGGTEFPSEPAPVVKEPEPARLPVEFRTIYFDFDDSSLTPSAREALRYNAAVLTQNPSIRLQIEGNCDERGSAEYNLALGQRRADSARQYLVDLGVDASRLSTLSYGEENPAVRGSNEIAWAKNRRDEFKVR